LISAYCYGKGVKILGAKFRAGVALLLLMCAAMLSTTPAAAQNGVGQTKAQLSAAIILTKSSDLFFGDIAVGTGGTVTINAQTGAVTTAGGIVSVTATTSRARFTAIGTQGRVITMSLSPAPNITLNRVGGGATMTVNQLRRSINGGTAGPMGPNFTLPSNGTADIAIGGRLNVGANQMQGVYTGTFTLTVNYQ
jgi:Domain of unknown function (DUF4402)